MEHITVIICDTDIPQRLRWRPCNFRNDDFNLTNRNRCLFIYIIPRNTNYFPTESVGEENIFVFVLIISQ